MKFNIGDHLQEIDSIVHGIVTDITKDSELSSRSFFTTGRAILGTNNKVVYWYLITNDELELINHWLPESNLELHKQPLREQKLKELGI